MEGVPPPLLAGVTVAQALDVRRRRRALWWAAAAAAAAGAGLAACALTVRLLDRLLPAAGDSEEGDAREGVVLDPVLPALVAAGRGESLAEMLEALDGVALWEKWLDSLHFDHDSPARRHVRQLVRSPNVVKRLDELFDKLADGKGHVTKAGFSRFSEGLGGDVHFLLHGTRRVGLLPADPADAAFVEAEFDRLFPPHAPLDRVAFRETAQLVLLRRLVRTLARFCGGLHSVRTGLAANTVVDIWVELDGERSFRLHTVAPGGEKALGAVTEDEDAEDT